MKPSQRDPKAILPLSSSAFHILLVLSAGERHGYSITKEVEAATDGMIRLGPGTLYRLIKEMLADGWIVETPNAIVDDQRRRYYRLTPWGRNIARAEAQRLEDLVRLARNHHLLSAM